MSIIKKTFLIIPIIGLVFQDTNALDIYHKKVIAFVEDVIISSKDLKLYESEIEFIKSNIKKSITDDRFEYVSFPANIFSLYRSDIQEKKLITKIELQTIINNTIAKDLISFLDTNKDDISKQYITDNERNSFLAIKAKAVGLSANNYEAVLNSGYFYVPYANINFDYSFEGNNYFKISLEVLWYKIIVDKHNNHSVIYIGSAKGYKDYSGESILGNTNPDKSVIRKRDFENAIENSCEEILFETKKLEVLKLTGSISEVNDLDITFNLGSREGLKLDDMFTIYEQVEGSNGVVKKEEVGFIKVRDIKNTSSNGQIIMGSGFGVGQDVQEYPQLGVNIIISGISLSNTIIPFNNKPTGFLGSSSLNNFALDIKSNTNSYGLQSNVDFHISDLIGISELWANIGAGFAWSTIDGNMFIRNNINTNKYDSAKIGLMTTFVIDGGITKKYYINRFGITIQGGGKFYYSSMSAYRNGSSTVDTSFSLSNTKLGLFARVGMEIYLTPSVLIGLSGDYTNFGNNFKWNAAATENDPNNKKSSRLLENNSVDNGPTFSSDNISYYFTVTYSFPSFKGGFFASLPSLWE